MSSRVGFNNDKPFGVMPGSLYKKSQPLLKADLKQKRHVSNIDPYDGILRVASIAAPGGVP